MLKDRDRHLLNDLERQLEHEDPAWVRQFKDPKPPPDTPRPATGDGHGPAGASDRL
jgi:Protein of unknown function (DUF3040)